MLVVDEPKVPYRKYLVRGLSDSRVAVYYHYMVNIAVFLGAEKERAEEEMKAAVELEIKLAELTLPAEERRNQTALYNPMTLAQLQTMCPEIPLVPFICAFLGLKVTPSEVVNVAVPSYILKVRQHLATVPARVLANFLVWKIVQSSVGFLSKQALDHHLELKKVLMGKSQHPPRWEKCVKIVAGLESSLFYTEGSLTNAVGAMYAKKFFPLEAKREADNIVDSVRAEFKKILDEIQWMDPVTKAKDRFQNL